MSICYFLGSEEVLLCFIYQYGVVRITFLINKSIYFRGELQIRTNLSSTLVIVLLSQPT